ncbi:hypothetical protein HTZ98_01540 [Ralstonia solanacearum]|uniref:hypothetical protein n=1 Tax=Ralstonia solanacearum TaxID=305 RepID=UPI0015857D95|nr:hypothetical protein [Ralstonia solanacearum]NUU69507.1 hypothetical protein [Ralstonia solanacearum]
MDENTVVRVKDVTATIGAFLKLGWVQRTEHGSYLTTGPYPHEPLEVPPQAPQQAAPVDPYSLLGLQMRGYRVMAGKTREEDRVEIGGGFFRITAARANGLI